MKFLAELKGPPCRGRGFTLIELLIVLAVAAILAGIAVPSMRDLVKSVRLTSATNDLFGSLMLARSEAVKRNSRVVLCKSMDGVLCSQQGGWEQGWLVFHDPNNNGQHEMDEDIVQRAQALSSELRLGGNLYVAKYISYTPAGVAKLITGAFQSGTLTLCNASSKPGPSRLIVLSPAGRPRVQKSSAVNCV